MTAVRQIRRIMLGSTLAAAAAAAFAQTSAQDIGRAPEAAIGAAAHGNAAMSAGVSGTANRGAGTGAGASLEPGASQRVVAPGPVDPLVQKRDADAAANAEYRDNKKALKQEYQSQLKAVKQQRKAAKREATDALKAQTGGGAASDRGTQH